MKKLEKMFKEAGLYSLDSPWIIEATDERVFAVVKAYAQSAIDEIKEKIAEEAVRGFVKQFQAEFSDMNFEYMDFAADRFLTDKESIRSVTIELK